MFVIRNNSKGPGYELVEKKQDKEILIGRGSAQQCSRTIRQQQRKRQHDEK